MLRQVDRGRLVGGGLVLDGQLVGVGEHVAHPRLHRPRVALLAVRAGAGEGDAGRTLQHLRAPDVLVEPAHAAVEMVRAVVRGELVGLSVEGEARLADAVAVAADDGAEVRVFLEIAVEGVEAQGHVGHGAGAIGHANRGDDRAIADRLDLDARLVREGEGLDRRAVARLAERLSPHPGLSVAHRPRLFRPRPRPDGDQHRHAERRA